MILRNYADLVAWKKAMAFVTAVYRLTRVFPDSERFGLVSQMRRAAVSIPSNIAEGHGRATRGEFLNHLSVARGSLNEVRTLLAVCRELGTSPPSSIEPLDAAADELSRILWALRRGLIKRSAYSAQRAGDA